MAVKILVAVNRLRFLYETSETALDNSGVTHVPLFKAHLPSGKPCTIPGSHPNV
jgi:hypothetical protein